MKNIVFIGMPASGKSTVGEIVAKELAYSFIDTDLLIQKQEGKLLKEIIKERGIDGFLAIENEVNCKVQADGAVISPGGSVVYCEEAMEQFRRHAHIVYLKVEFEEIERRVANAKARGVVLRKGQSLKMLYDEREELFRRYADVTIFQGGKDVEETVQEILKKIKI